MIDDHESASERAVGASAPESEPREAQATQPTRVNERLLDASTEFFAYTSRDVRTPLSLLLAPIQAILDGPASALAPGSRSALEAARRNALKLLQVLDTLSDVSGIERGGMRAGRVPADLASFTADLVGHFRPFCEAAGLRLIADCAPLPDQVAVDLGVWEKIVLYLVANAFTSTVEGTIEVRLRVQDGRAQLVVTDTSAGISETELQYVFSRFDRVASAGGDSSERIRFGLPYVRDLVQRHHGSIDVQSTVGRGTRFTVVLPFAARDGETASARSDAGVPAPWHVPTSDAVASPRGHVVIAEDHAETLEFLSYVLNAAGFTVDALADGHAALATCEVRAPDVVVSDVLMPGLNGLELIERLRADERTAVIPVLLLSVRGGEDSRIAGIEAGADDYLVKPLSSRELVARVDGAVRLGRLRRDIARRQQADLDALFSMAPDGFLVVGPNARILTANEQARKLFGYSMQELSGLQLEALIPASYRSAHIAHRERYERAPVVRLMNPLRGLRGLRSDGSEFIAEIALGPLQFRNQPCTIAIVRDVTERKRLEGERTEQEKRFRDLSRRLVDVQEAERRQLSMELHDRTSPQLAAIQIDLNMLGNVLGTRETEDVRALLDDTVHLIADTTASIREISSNLRPAVLDDGGLLPALVAYAQHFTQRTGIAIHLTTQDATRTLAPAVQSSLFRIVQEALTNCVKHAKAKNVTIRLSTDDTDLVSLMVADDGIGFDFERRSTPGLGLLTMRERAEFLGGRFSLETTPGHGTRILVLVPVMAAA